MLVSWSRRKGFTAGVPFSPCYSMQPAGSISLIYASSRLACRHSLARALKECWKESALLIPNPKINEWAQQWWLWRIHIFFISHFLPDDHQIIDSRISSLRMVVLRTSSKNLSATFLHWNHQDWLQINYLTLYHTTLWLGSSSVE